MIIIIQHSLRHVSLTERSWRLDDLHIRDKPVLSRGQGNFAWELIHSRLAAPHVSLGDLLLMLVVTVQVASDAMVRWSNVHCSGTRSGDAIIEERVKTDGHRRRVLHQ